MSKKFNMHSVSNMSYFLRVSVLMMIQAQFVDFVLRVIYATPQQLGWDLTIRRLPPADNGTQYDIDVNVGNHDKPDIITKKMWQSPQWRSTLKGLGPKEWLSDHRKLAW